MPCSCIENLHQFYPVPGRVPQEQSDTARNGLMVRLPGHPLCIQVILPMVQVINAIADMAFALCGISHIPLLDRDMKLLIAHLKPATAISGQRIRFGDRHQPHNLLVEIKDVIYPGGCGGYLNMVDCLYLHYDAF